VLDRRPVRTPECLILPRLIATADAAFDPPAADHIEQRDLLGEPDWMMPDDDVGGLAEADALGVRRYRHLHHQRVRAHLRALGLNMVLGELERLEPELFGENPWAHRVYQGVLRRPMHFRQRAVVERDAVFVRDDR